MTVPAISAGTYPSRSEIGGGKKKNGLRGARNFPLRCCAIPIRASRRPFLFRFAGKAGAVRDSEAMT